MYITTPYHPQQGNGQVERFNCTVEAILAKTVQDNQRESQLHKAKACLHVESQYMNPLDFLHTN